jgi:hypothetical protein
METGCTNDNSNSRSAGPAWASWLGAVAIVFGIFLAADQGNELMKQIVIAPDSAAVQDKLLKCPEDELEEEGISMAECELMATNIKNMIVSRPDWFRAFQITLMTIGILVAAGSILVGVALVDYRQWAPTAAIVIFGGLLAIDLIGFMAAVNTGPLLRATYLWDILLWFIIHLMMLAGAFAGRSEEIMAAQIAR